MHAVPALGTQWPLVDDPGEEGFEDPGHVVFICQIQDSLKVSKRAFAKARRWDLAESQYQRDGSSKRMEYLLAHSDGLHRHIQDCHQLGDICWVVVQLQDG